MNLINIWDMSAPVIKEGKDFTPYMTFFKAKNPINKAVLVIPGGGYYGVCDTYEGEEVAEYFNEFGVDAFVLRYSTVSNLEEPVFPKPFCEATRAMRLIRANADMFDINPNCLGIMGFSAGGHLASWVSTKFNDKLSEDDDLFDKFSARPDFSVLCYAVLDLYKLTPYEITGINLLGENASCEMKDKYSTPNFVSEDTPPTFLFHTQADQAVPVINSVKYYEKMIEYGVKGELHIFEPGCHGMGLAKPLEHIDHGDTDYCSSWPKLLKNWIINMI